MTAQVVQMNRRGGPEGVIDAIEERAPEGFSNVDDVLSFDERKAIVRGYSWTVIPITWRNRRTGVPKLKIKEMGSRYLFICLYVWLEKYFSRGDYRKTGSTH